MTRSLPDRPDLPRWTNETEFVLGETRFLCHQTWGRGFVVEPGQMRIIKGRGLLDRFIATVVDTRPRRIFEVGIFKGGSTALLYLLSRPEGLVAVDLAEEPVIELERFLDENGARSRVSVHYGIDQADQARLKALAVDAFGAAPIDLVVDDASHRLVETRATFHALFPLLRPGGVYFLEDWSWAHTPGGAFFVPGAPLSVLVFELTLAAAYAPELVESVTVYPECVVVRRGPAEAPGERFDLADHMDDLGKRLVERLRS